MNKPISLRLGAAALALFASCFVARETTNAPLSYEHVAQLHPGETTAQEVAELLGAPSEVVQLGFRSAWRYNHVESKRAGIFLLVVTFLDTDARSDRVWVFFDENDVLTNVGSTFEADGAEWQMPWQDRAHGDDADAAADSDDSSDAAVVAPAAIEPAPESAQ